MVFSGYSNASYLPLDSDQGVTFYKNENSLFAPPPAAAAASNIALVCRRNSSVAEMLTTSTGSGPFGGQAMLHQQRNNNNVCNDFQPVAHLSSNGYYGYVPPPANSAGPKVMSTHLARVPATSADDSYAMMMDCSNSGVGGGFVQVENNQHQHQQQQHHLRKRKEYSEQVDSNNCKRRKTWLEQPNDAGFASSPNWNLPPTHQMDSHDQLMDTFSSPLQFHQSPISMNAPTSIAFNGFQQHSQQHQTMISTPQPQTILQPKNCLFRASSPSPNKPLGFTEISMADKRSSQLHDLQRHPHSAAGADDCQMWEDLFISLHGSGFYLAC